MPRLESAVTVGREWLYFPSFPAFITVPLSACSSSVLCAAFWRSSSFANEPGSQLPS